jgi:predicted sulfurtransferase/predicted O-methyltransferase YrrM
MSFRSFSLFRPSRLIWKYRRFSTTHTEFVNSNHVESIGEFSELRDAASSPPVTANIHVDALLCKHLNLRRKTKLLISTKPTTPPLTIPMFRTMIESKFAKLANSSYRIHFQPEIFNRDKVFLLQDDQQLTEIMTKAKEDTKSITFVIDGSAESFPIAEDAPLINPSDSSSYTMVSFFSFHPIQNPKEVQDELFALWNPMKALGRVYVAREGINAQMAIPSNIFDYFQVKTKELKYFEESRFNTDPEMPKDLFLELKPFRNLHIRLRSQIVSDGLLNDESLTTENIPKNDISSSETSSASINWRDSGSPLTPLQWHEALVKEGSNITLLDCRNSYESDIGVFENAVPLNTTLFSESWSALNDVLQDIPKDKPIYTYCTGGIRCVKINAFLKQKLGFENTFRLEGGIIAYRRELDKHNNNDGDADANREESQQQNTGKDVESEGKGLKSKFHGTNYVFDERIHERITHEILTSCDLCGVDYDSFHNCPECNVRFLQCPACAEKYSSFCCLSCKSEHEKKKNHKLTNIDNSLLQQLNSKNKQNGKLLLSNRQRSLLRSQSSQDPQHSHAVYQSQTKNQEENSSSSPFSWIDHLSSYSERLSERPPRILQQIKEETEKLYPKTASRMLSSANQGAFLSMLATLTGAKNVLEVGSFTGFSTLCLAMKFEDFTHKPTGTVVVEPEKNGNCRQVYSCDADENAVTFAKQFIEQTPWKSQIHLSHCNASQFLEELKEQGKKFDLVFLDADKKEYITYFKTLIDTENPLVNHHSLIVIDNTLWKGLVLNEVKDLESFAPSGDEYGSSKMRYQLIAKQMHELNTFLLHHPQLRTLLLPIRDGLTVVQYLSPQEVKP